MDMDIPSCTSFYGLQHFQKKSAQSNRINSDAFSDNEQSAKECQKSIRNIRKFKNIFLKSILLFQGQHFGCWSRRYVINEKV